MKIATLERYLIEHPLFRDLDPDYVSLLTECASNVRFAAGDMIFRQGQPADGCYLIRHGTVSLEVWSPTAKAITIQTFGPGEVLGWSWLFPPYRWHFDARARELVRALALDGKCLREKCDRDPKLGYTLMKRFSSLIHDRMQAARLQMIDIYGPTSA